ncbi:hypothetical protein KAFR_0F03500 [Kazachstania africana CBS 2517]|uniref:Uncharacterized protein n=1 Tax=Kazachstania africana (strain ATCC 22294 / BCRC 22015 / CBS 2517 / CECT 1963 / NBRC 1671 / NRRL Y-8276) TaxID=1071382 RepID=H2AX46_KAZAF|nr:hypothetical protein KAFR_0F03500 [Kazachstania africana CBS 2517]CCF58946.1 hypothetical protein KAFR_0F03500 [Kazachstania africana CBS 2517]
MSIEQLERRRKKFSKETRDRLINDPLLDAALLSRSKNIFLKNLQQDQQQREQLLAKLKAEERSDVLDHGLRKLREIIVSIFDSNNNDVGFVRFVEEVYTTSFEFFLSNNQFQKMGPILKFIVDNLVHIACYAEYFEAYIVYISHIQNDLSSSLKLIKGKDALRQYNDAMLLSLIYGCSIDSPHTWFKLLMEKHYNKDDSLMYRMLLKAGKIEEMQLRVINIIKVSYNQISMAFLKDFWLCKCLLLPKVLKELEALYFIEQKADGTCLIYFKKR